MKNNIDPANLHHPADAAAAWLLSFADNPPDEATTARWHRWLDSTPECRSAYARAFAAWQALGDIDETPWLDALAREANAELQQRMQSQRGWRVRRRMLAVAGVVMALLVGAAGWWYALSPTTYATGVGEQRTVQLEDGSRLSLDADTQVQVAYTNDHRRLRLLQGRVACKVAKDMLRPFSVRAANKVVVATGTKFSVELVSDQVRVVLYQGHVAVLDGDSAGALQTVHLAGSQAPADTILSPGHELVMPEHHNSASMTPINTAQSLSWEHGQLHFNDEPLALAVARVNRYSNIRLAVGDTTAAQTRISGVFTVGNTNAFISGVTTIFPLRVVDRDGVPTLETTSQ